MNQVGFFTKTIAGLTSALESVILNEELAHTRGLLQSLDPRVKLFTLLLFIIIISLARSLWLLAALLILIIAIVFFSRVPSVFFLRRVLIFLPFTVIIVLPALFFTPGNPAWQIVGRAVITFQGLHTAGFLLLRVMDSISLGLLIVLTTPWNSLLSALRWFHLPAIIIAILGMTYRYIFLFLHTVNTVFLARRSRSLGVFSGSENRRWLNQTLATVLIKTQHLSEEVYLAMLARGYQGEVYTFNRLKLKSRDYICLSLILVVALALTWSIYR